MVFPWFAATVLRGRRHLFATGAVVAGFAATIAINAINPDALIVRTDVSRPNVDASYLASLSDDALPTLVSRLPRLDPALRRSVARALLRRSNASESWLSWNSSRSRAHSLLAAHRDELRELAR